MGQVIRFPHSDGERAAFLREAQARAEKQALVIAQKRRKIREMSAELRRQRDGLANVGTIYPPSLIGLIFEPLTRAREGSKPIEGGSYSDHAHAILAELPTYPIRHCAKCGANFVEPETCPNCPMNAPA